MSTGKSDMPCDRFRDALDARLDGVLLPDEARDVDQHLATCASCAREYAMLSETHRLLSENLMRYAAPDVLKARIRGALSETVGRTDSATPPRRAPVRRVPGWWRQLAAGILIAAASSTLTWSALGTRSASVSETDELLASHVRSLMPGHLTDVVSTDQHNVKPWFNGRVDMSPSVPRLDSAGFPLVGGRTDYVRGRAVPVVVYARRQHMINVYAWPEPGSASEPRASTRNGYHFVTWRGDGVEYWAVSDLNTKELDEFVASFRTQ
jgi:anti-sigma factor RsiW